MQGAYTSLGSVIGWLDTMSARRMHKGLLVVGFYDPETRRAVTGCLSADMAEEAHDLYWRKRVIAKGEVTRNRRGQAVRMEIEELEEFGERGRASVDDLLGIAPDWLGGQDVDEYIEEARRA